MADQEGLQHWYPTHSEAFDLDNIGVSPESEAAIEERKKENRFQMYFGISTERLAASARRVAAERTRQSEMRDQIMQQAVEIGPVMQTPDTKLEITE
jgi:hypothetical protein